MPRPEDSGHLRGETRVRDLTARVIGGIQEMRHSHQLRIRLGFAICHVVVESGLKNKHSPPADEVGEFVDECVWSDDNASPLGSAASSRPLSTPPVAAVVQAGPRVTGRADFTSSRLPSRLEPSRAAHTALAASLLVSCTNP